MVTVDYGQPTQRRRRRRPKCCALLKAATPMPNHTHLSELLGETRGHRGRSNHTAAHTGGRRPEEPRAAVGPPRHRVRRQRMPREGMLVQVDGSHHRWLGDDGPPFALLLAVDDATGTVVNGLFCEQENTRDYFLLMRGLIQRHGIPIALYTDRHSVFKNVPGSGHAGAPTQFSRAMDDLGVQMVFALSPQAKGRVERTAGTFQDRLVTELRLAGATTIEEANVVLKEFLDRFNARFGVAAQHPEAAYRPLGSGVCLDTVLCFRHSRRVARDNTVKYRWRTLQLLPGTERAQLCGSGGGRAGRPGRPAGSALPGRDHRQPGGATPPRHPQKLQRLFLTRDTLTSRSQRSEQALGGGPGSTRRTDGRWATRPSTTAPLESARHLPCSAGSPLHSRRQGGNAVQKAKRRGLSIRGVARELGIHRDTAKKYMEALSPPMKRDRGV